MDDSLEPLEKNRHSCGDWGAGPTQVCLDTVLDRRRPEIELFLALVLNKKELGRRG